MGDVMLLASASDVFFAERFEEVATEYARRCDWRTPGLTGAEFEDGITISVGDVSILLDAIGCEGGIAISSGGEVLVTEPSPEALERVESVRRQLPFEFTIEGALPTELPDVFFFDVSVPSTAGLSLGDALDALEARGILIGELGGSQNAACAVLGTEPPAGAVVPTGSEVSIILTDCQN